MDTQTQSIYEEMEERAAEAAEAAVPDISVDPIPKKQIPLPLPQQRSKQTDTVPAKSVDVFPAPLSYSVKQQIEPQSKHRSKFKHFQFKDRETMERRLTQRIRSAVSDAEVAYHYDVMKRPDVLLTRRTDGSLIGKVHFLHFDRPDMCDPEKWYVKLYFYEFQRQEDYDRIRDAMVGFFKQMDRPIGAQSNTIRTRGGRRKHTTRKRKHKRSLKLKK